MTPSTHAAAPCRVTSVPGAFSLLCGPVSSCSGALASSGPFGERASPLPRVTLQGFSCWLGAQMLLSPASLLLLSPVPGTSGRYPLRAVHRAQSGRLTSCALLDSPVPRMPGLHSLGSRLSLQMPRKQWCEKGKAWHWPHASLPGPSRAPLSPSCPGGDCLTVPPLLSGTGGLAEPPIEPSTMLQEHLSPLAGGEWGSFWPARPRVGPHDVHASPVHQGGHSGRTAGVRRLLASGHLLVAPGRPYKWQRFVIDVHLW